MYISKDRTTMSPKTHLCASLLAGAILCQYVPHHTTEIVAGAMCMSNLADIDQDVKFLRHRGQTHSFIWPMILYIVSRCVVNGRYIVLGACIGYLSHVVIDHFNGKGCESFWPLTDKNYRVADLKYDGAGEKVIMYCMIVGIVVNIVGVENIKVIAGGMIR